MIIEPRVRGFICITSHPTGCYQNVLNQIEFTKSKGKFEGPKKVLVIGASTGFGLSSRIASSFGVGASTIGVFLEKPGKSGRTATAGWYNTAAFETEAHKDGIYAKSINGDAFSNEIKEKTLDLIEADLGQVDLVVYSIASGVRVHPETGVKHRSALKPIGKSFEGKTLNFHTGVISEVAIEPANDEDIANTVEVMGGDDWALWIDALKERNLLAENAATIAYSYVGSDITDAIYRKGTIGKAKDHLEDTAIKLNERLSDINGKAIISINKGLVTQASSAIPVLPLYISLLYKIMKEKNIHEGCIEQIYRLFTDCLYNNSEIPTDEKGRIRVDDWEMRDDVQELIVKLWEEATTENLSDISDIEGYRTDFYNLFGFKVDGVDYEADVNEVVDIPGLV